MILAPLPHNAEAEQAVLGSLLIDNRGMERVSDFLLAEHFYEPLHARVFVAIDKLIRAGRRASPISLKAEFENDPAVGELTAKQYLGHLVACGSAVLDVQDYARTVRDLAMRRQLVEIGEALVDDARSGSIDASTDTMIERAEVSLASLAETGSASAYQLTAMDAATDALEAVAAAYRRNEEMIGLSTGLNDLDSKTGGLVAGELIVLAGRPSMGKSALAAGVAYHNARRRIDENLGVPVGFFSLEMSASQIVLRLIAEQSGVSANRLRRGRIDPVQFDEVLAITEERVAPSRIYFDQSGSLSILQLSARARRMKRRHDIGLLVVDYIQLMSGTGARKSSPVAEVAEITGGLKAIAKELDIPVLALSQLSRNVESRDDKRPVLSDLRESGAIEQDADVVLFIFREEYYTARREPPQGTARHIEWENDLAKVRNKAEVIIAKQRQGPIGTVELRFDGPLTSFSDLARQEGGLL